MALTFVKEENSFKQMALVQIVKSTQLFQKIGGFVRNQNVNPDNIFGKMGHVISALITSSQVLIVSLASHQFVMFVNI